MTSSPVIAKEAVETLPIGSIVMWCAADAPPGWLICDGSIYPKGSKPGEHYFDLWKVIGHTFGDMPQSESYDPNTEFYVPDLQGRFIRGVDLTGKRDPDSSSRTDMQSGKTAGAVVGSLQEDEFKSHNHQYKNYPLRSGKSLSSGLGDSNVIEQDDNVYLTGGAETRPVNAYFFFIIKAF